MNMSKKSKHKILEKVEVLIKQFACEFAYKANKIEQSTYNDKLQTQDSYNLKFLQDKLYQTLGSNTSMSLPRKEYEKQLNSHTKSAHALLDQMNLVHKTLEAQLNDNQFDWSDRKPKDDALNPSKFKVGSAPLPQVLEYLGLIEKCDSTDSLICLAESWTNLSWSAQKIRFIKDQVEFYFKDIVDSARKVVDINGELISDQNKDMLIDLLESFETVNEYIVKKGNIKTKNKDIQDKFDNLSKSLPDQINHLDSLLTNISKNEKIGSETSEYLEKCIQNCVLYSSKHQVESSVGCLEEIESEMIDKNSQLDSKIMKDLKRLGKLMKFRAFKDLFCDKLNQIKTTFEQTSVLEIDQLVQVLVEIKKVVRAEKRVIFTRLQSDLKAELNPKNSFDINAMEFMTVAEESIKTFKEQITNFKQCLESITKINSELCLAFEQELSAVKSKNPSKIKFEN